ncbi:Coenzyme F420 hydrogenase/dehydrogenase, beta subunit C-terminal domain [Marinobacter zhanjiangensis]|uniref:Coenzyme F420 hydrogenase n=1 Tax=Marinobacter zhanjiangensis TaxID=578215 RepID=A0ABQ3AXI7_9GAMM|nr:Coenzyme F420 hydrogenase/dehydrogenase, beta subunit C-terminal domain [Marinobacter zhanjiangensis]GGY69791.1 coenzyme F420 hydrogenase [Marinobacter zhanjiangensis]
MSTANEYQALNDTVISNGFCVGCGACAVPEESPFHMALNEYGQYQAVLPADRVFARTSFDIEKVCPFGSGSASEDQIGKDLFEEHCSYDSQVGYYQQAYAGYVTEGTFRERGSSGGMGTWILNELLAKGYVDHVINVRSDVGGSVDSNLLFGYTISSSLEETQSGGKSRYYPIELSRVLQKVRSTPGRYAVIGLPCFIKSVRLLQRQDPLLAERIRFCAGLVCGHLKSTRYADSLAWQMGIAPEKLESIDFRVKNPEAPANRYSTSVTSDDRHEVVPTNKLFGTDWGAGAFKYKACDFCDDVFAETADIVLGDAWLPDYVEDSQGTNIIVTRHPDIQEVIENARNEGRLVLDDITIAQAIQSQDAGLRHRKVAISYRLFREHRKGSWVPTKRVAPSKTLKPRYEQKRQRLRVDLRILSHNAFVTALKRNDFEAYLNSMLPVYREYKKHSSSLMKRSLLLFKRIVKKFVRVVPGVQR